MKGLHKAAFAVWSSRFMLALRARVSKLGERQSSLHVLWTPLPRRIFPRPCMYIRSYRLSRSGFDTCLQEISQVVLLHAAVLLGRCHFIETLWALTSLVVELDGPFRNSSLTRSISKTGIHKRWNSSIQSWHMMVPLHQCKNDLNGSRIGKSLHASYWTRTVRFLCNQHHVYECGKWWCDTIHISFKHHAAFPLLLPLISITNRLLY